MGSRADIGAEMPPPQSEEGAALLQSALNALPMQIVVLDGDGVIRYTNRVWRMFGTANGLEEPVTEGTDYLGVCEAADAGPGPAAAEGIRDVLRGHRDEFSMEYDCHGPETERWFSLRATRFEAPLEGPAGGTHALVAHLDVTDQKLAERPTAVAADLPSSVEETVPVDVGTIARSAWADVDPAGQTLSVVGTRRVDADQSLLSLLLRGLFGAAVAAGATTVEVTATDDGFAVLDDGRPLDERDPDDGGPSGGVPAGDSTVGDSWATIRRVADVHDWSVRTADGPDGGARFEIELTSRRSR